MVISYRRGGSLQHLPHHNPQWILPLLRQLRPRNLRLYARPQRALQPQRRLRTPPWLPLCQPDPTPHSLLSLLLRLLRLPRPLDIHLLLEQAFPPPNPPPHGGAPPHEGPNSFNIDSLVIWKLSLFWSSVFLTLFYEIVELVHQSYVGWNCC